MTEVPLDAQGKATILRDGDILELAAVVSQYKDAITLRGNVANPGRYTWRPGMRVRDLIPDKDALITRDYWLKRSQLGQPMLTYIPTCLPQTPYGIPNLRYGIAVGEEGEDPIWRYSSAGNPNLIGLQFKRAEGTSNSINGFTDDGVATTDGGLDCAKGVEPSTVFNGNAGNNGRTTSNSTTSNTNPGTRTFS